MTTSPPWNQLPLDKANDGETYWVAFERMFSRPFQATWNDTDWTWRPSDGGGDLPWYLLPYYRKL
jgi:hypothetical protein